MKFAGGRRDEDVVDLAHVTAGGEHLAEAGEENETTLPDSFA
jgi:hypothetical protein